MEPVVDVCDNTNFWRGEIRNIWQNDNEPPIRVLTPSDFFTPDGATYNDYDKEKGEYVSYKFEDISCQTDNFEVEFQYEFNHGGMDSIVNILHIWGQPREDLSFLGQLRSSLEEEDHSSTREIRIGASSNSSSNDVLRSNQYGSSKFVYKNENVYIYSNGNLNRVEHYPTCHVAGMTVEFPIGGGKIRSLTFKDNTNGTTWMEDFSDCSKSNIFPRCPQPEPEELEIFATTPTCNNSDFILKAETNLEEIKWAGPNGFKAEGTNILIPYEEAQSGCYIAYGKRDRCSQYVYEKVCVNIPNLDVKAEINSVDLCTEEKYVWGDTVLTTSGLYTKHTTNPETGCDKVEIVRLKVHKTRVDIYEELCFGESTTFDGQIIGVSGDYTNTIRNSNNTCDSTTVLHVNVLPKVPWTYVDSTLCYGENWLVAGWILPPNYQVSKRYQNENGCDSIVTFRSFGRPKDELFLEEKPFCENSEVEAFGTIYKPTKDTTIVKLSKNKFGCDHTEYLPLKKVPSIENTIVDTILCYEDKLVMPNGDQYTRPTTFKYKYESIITGCDSIVTYNLTFRKQDLVIEDTVFLCEEGGMNRLEKKRVFETNEHGCKRTIETPILHRNILKTVQYLELCYNEKVTISDKEYTESGEYIDIVTASNGCDSIITTHLTIHPKREQILEEILVCTTEKNGRDTLEIKTNDGNNCPLYVRTPYLYESSKTEIIDTVICEGYSVEVAGETYNTSGEWEIHTTAKNSCDSTIYLKLLVSDMIEKDIYDTICFEDVYTTRTATYTETGDYTEKYLSTTACDTIINIHLFKRDIMTKVLPTILICEDIPSNALRADYSDYFDEIDEKTLCTIHVEQPYHFEYTEYLNFNKDLCFEDTHTDSRGKIYNTPGDYTIIDTFTASNGCLSVQTTFLTIKDRREKILPEEKICHDTKSGRDSIITILNDGGECPLYEIQPQLFLNPTQSTIDTFICANKELNIEGNRFNTAGKYTVITTAENGCDSTITINLGINPIRTIETFDTICAGEVLVTDKDVYNSSGVYTETYTDYDANKCDEIHIIHLYIRDVLRDTLPTIKECMPVGSEGLYIDKVDYIYSTIDIKTGCNIEVYQPYHYAFHKLNNENITICEGTSYIIDDIEYNIDGTYTRLYNSIEGCDSTFTFTITTELMERRTLEPKLNCSRENIGVEWYKEDTIPPLPFELCPSIEITPTRNIPIYDTYFDTTVCSGATVEFEGNIYQTAGEKKVIYTATNGCDSVLHLNINHIIPKETNLEINLCYGETHTSSIKSYDKSGYYVERLSDINGCDSVAYLRINIEPLIEKHLPKVTFCETDSIEYHGRKYTQATIHTDTLYSPTGCPIYHYTEIRTDKKVPYVEKEYYLCEEEKKFINAYPDGMDGIKYSWYPSTYLEKINSGSTFVTPKQSLNYTVTMTKGMCTTKGLVKVNVLQRPHIKDIVVDKYTQIATINAIGGKYMMYYCDEINHESSNNEIAFDSPGGYDIKVVDETGCMDSTHFFYAPPVFPEPFFVPDAEGDDALWQIKGLEAYNGFQIWIYDRWGKLLAHYKNSFPGWDGTYNGHRMPSTDYWYIISIDLGEIELSGHFTLIRNM